MYTLLPLFITIAAVSSADLQVGTEGGRKIYDAKIEASPAIWTQVQHLTINATGNEVISRVVVTDLRTDKDGEVKITEGGEGHKNVTLELKSPSVLRGFEFQVQVYAAPDRKGRETVADTLVASGEPQTPEDTSVPITNDTAINKDAKPVTTDVMNATGEVSGTSAMETPVEGVEQMKKRDTVPQMTQEGQNTESEGQEDAEDVPQETQGSESDEVIQESQDTHSEDMAQESQDTDDEDASQDSQDSDSEVGIQDSQDSDSGDVSLKTQSSDTAKDTVQIPINQERRKKRDTGDMSQASQVDVYQSQETQDSGSEEEEESTDEEQQKRAAQEMPQIQFSGEMPEIQMPEVEIPEVQIPEIEIADGIPQVQIGVEMSDEQRQKRAAQETPETETDEEVPQVQTDKEVPQVQTGEEVPEEQSEPLPQDPIAQYVSEQNVSNENPIQAPLVPEVMLEENNSTQFNDSAVIVERSAYYKEETEPPTEPTTEETTTEETTTTETPTTTTTTEEPKKHHYHHNWQDSHGY